MRGFEPPKRGRQRLLMMTGAVAFLFVAASEPARMVVAAAFHDPSTMLAQRSPGGRAPGALTQTKHRLLASTRGGRPGVGGPEERVLSNIRSRPESGVGDAPGLTDFGPALTPSDVLPTIGNGGSGGDNPASTVPAIFGQPGLGGAPSVSPIVGGGGSGGGGAAPTATVPPIAAVPDVPEPSTWLMMLIGFGLAAVTARKHGFGPKESDEAILQGG